jgi:hypothetical protein
MSAAIMSGLPRRCLCASAFALVLGGAFACAVPVRGETVRTIDDKTTSGAIKGFEHGELLLQPKPADPALVKIPLVEIVEVRIKALAVRPQPAVATTKPSAAPGGILGALFGIGSVAAPPTVQSEAPTAVSAPIAVTTPTTNGYATGYAVVPATTAKPAMAVQPVETRAASKASPSSAAPVWDIEFANGDHVEAELSGWTDDRLRLKLEAPVGTSLAMPADRVHSVWSSSAALVRKAKELKQSALAEDIAFVEKDGQVKSVAGVAAGIDGGFLKFKFDEEPRRIKLNRVVGILLAPRDIPPERSIFETFNFSRGDVLSGRLVSIEHNVARVKPLWGGEGDTSLGIPLDRLASIDVKNGRLVWLGDLKPAAVLQVPYFDRLMPYRVNQSLTGGGLMLADGPVSKGIAVHTKCVLTYDIGGQFERFRAKVGFQQPEGKLGRAAVRIIGDGKTLWEETGLRGDATKPAAVDLGVVGVKSLVLQADYGPNFDVAGRVVWGEARLVKAAK